MAWGVVNGPQTEPVSVNEAVAHLRVDGSEEDELIGNLIKAARQHVETATGRALMSQTWRTSLSGFPAGSIRLPGRVQSVDSVTYYDADDTEQTFADYREVLTEPAVIAPADQWPTTADRIDAVTVTITAGWSDAESVPQALKQAMLLLVAHWFESRTAVVTGSIATEIPLAFDALIWPYRTLTV